MGRRRGSTKTHGIRKKKASKQTLVRVAERRDKKQERIEAAILARNGIRKHALVGKLPTGQGFDALDGKVTMQKFAEQDQGDRHERFLARKNENRQSVYKELIQCLAKKSGSADSSQTQRANPNDGSIQQKPNPDEQANESSKMSGGAVASEGGETEKKSRIDNDICMADGRVSAENYAAATRESSHFGSEVVPKYVPEKAKVLGTIPGLGRVSVTVPEDQVEGLSKLLSSDMAEVDDRMLGMQPSLYAKWRRVLEKDFPGIGAMFSRLHRAFIAIARDYRDVFMCGKHSKWDDDLLRKLYTVHCLAHVLRSRNRVLRNDLGLGQERKNMEPTKDQGFNRAKVLLLLPMKNVAYEVVKSLQALAVCPDEKEDRPQIANKERFEEEFSPGEQEDGHSDEVYFEGEANSVSGRKHRKPDDYRRTFRGNIDDDFKLGISFTKKSMKLYSDFYSSDVIVASPLGLRRLLAEKSRGSSSKREKLPSESAEEWKSGIGSKSEKQNADDANTDFLSSIEICVLDGLHLFSMQNWETLQQSVSMMNNIPSTTRDTDFSRVRDWCLDGLMKQFRQTILLSEYRNSEFLSLYRALANHSGKVQILQLPRELGTMADVMVSIRQTFFRLPDSGSPLDALDTRYHFFFDKVLPQLRSLINCHSLVVIPTYFDYVRVRNKLVELAKEDASIRFTSMCEYSKPSDVSRARSRLYDGSVSMVLMTERFHFFWRHWIRGANTIVWYSLPENAMFYTELLNMTTEAAESGQSLHAITLYNRYDSFCLERIVGSSRCKKMVSKQSRSMYLFL
ncbi:Digestive organ expansion factor-like [Gracilariopsis chorda]|uniref:Digestive organ expansion factor-like n=1 Tax=Gracilariopsis chorda TaxID=448386 RepID=A0A2V3J6R7_9FLOR|nr:Digestive organ expansion factor-like [Gracilariopsis chorda]|eukprot:PXF50126.1 Digestive organ expansion factor-like [Gracilariopsis chorda]